MNPTRAQAMTSTQTHFRGFNGSVQETRLFPIINPEVIEQNMALTETFLENMFNNFEFNHNNSYIWKQNIPVEVVFDYLTNYQAHEQDGGFNMQEILNYIRRRVSDNEVSTWSVVLAGKSTHGSQIFPNIQQTVNTFGRGSVGNGRIDQLTDDAHLCLDLENIPADSKFRRATIDYRNPRNPLLLIYILDKNFQPEHSDRGRNYVNLYNGLPYSHDTVGLGIVFPDSPSITDQETNQYYSSRGIPIE